MLAISRKFLHNFLKDFLYLGVPWFTKIIVSIKNLPWCCRRLCVQSGDNASFLSWIKSLIWLFVTHCSCNHISTHRKQCFFSHRSRLLFKFSEREWNYIRITLFELVIAILINSTCKSINAIISKNLLFTCHSCEFWWNCSYDCTTFFAEEASVHFFFWFSELAKSRTSF